MLATFAWLTAAEGMPGWEQLRPERAWAWRALLWSAAAVTFLLVIVAGGGARAATASAEACRHRATGRVDSRDGPF